MSDYGIKVTTDGYDVSTATVLQQTFNSSVNTLKIADTGMITNTAIGWRIVDFNHGFSYRPGLLFWWDANNGQFYLGNTIYNFGQRGVDGTAYNTKIEFSIYTSTSTTIRIFYVVLADPGY